MWQSVVDHWNALTKQQKFSVIVLGLCGFFAFGLSLYRVEANVIEPFLVDKVELLKTKGIIGQTPDEEEAKQKRTDTDGDGLSDWDETHTFHTNPNLKDTCGDGITDNVRMATGKNLNCVGGQGSGTPPSPEAPTPAAQPSSNALSPFQMNAQLSGSQTGQTPDASSVIPRDPAAIREALRGHIDQSQLDAVSDDELLQLYDQAVAAQQAQASSTR